MVVPTASVTVVGGVVDASSSIAGDYGLNTMTYAVMRSGVTIQAARTLSVFTISDPIIQPGDVVCIYIKDIAGCSSDSIIVSAT